VQKTPTVPPASAPVPARAHQVEPLEALEAFARVFGYVRYFHPTDAAAAADWSGLAAQGSRYVVQAKTTGDLAERLEHFFTPLAPTIEIWVAGEPPPAAREAPTGPHADLVYWQYLGYPGAILSLYSPPYSKVRVGVEDRGRRFAEVPARDAVSESEVAPGLFVRVPVTLHRDEAQATPAKAKAKGLDAELGRLARSKRGFTDLDVRRGAVIELWNVLRHFYPYQAEVEVDWRGQLRTALASIEHADLDQSIVALQVLVAALEDGHGEVGHPGRGTQASLPFSLDIIEDRAVVIATSEPNRFAIGDVVTKIDGESAIERISASEALLSGSPQWRRFKAAAWEVPKGPKGTPVKVSVQAAGGARTVATVYEGPDPAPHPRPDSIHMYDDGVWYVDLTRALWKDIEPRLPELAAAPGVVFDVRGYPEDTHQIIDYLIEGQEDALWMHVPAIVAPDGDFVSWRHLGWHRSPAEPHIGGKVAFLTGPGAISYGESLIAYIEAHQLGTRVGAPTAGANGDIVRVDAAGGFFVIFTGMRVTRHDGTSFHRVGLAPELPVVPTLSGLRAGRDEVLEVGLSVARGEVDSHGARTSPAAP